jgi:hypothetical protein
MSNAKDPAASPTPELLDNCSECNGKGGQCYACGAGAGRTLSTTVSKQAHIGAQDTNKSKIGGVPSDKDIKATRSRSKSVDKSSGSKVVDSSCECHFFNRQSIMSDSDYSKGRRF